LTLLDKINHFLILDTDSIVAAVDKIESNRYQTVFVVNGRGKIQGVITNGDLRRYILSGGDLRSPTKNCMNTEFFFSEAKASREEILKHVDLGYMAIPVLDVNRKIIDVVTHDHTNLNAEQPILSRSRAPVRISFGGGGSDLTYFFKDHPGAVLSASIALYSHATLVPRIDRDINIFSEDLDSHDHYESISELHQSSARNLLSSVVSVINPQFGFDLYVRSDFPVGSGLGGSSAVATAVIAAFNEMRRDHWSKYEIAEIAFHAERILFGISGGWQDQYASAFGGLNFMEFNNEKNLVHAIRLENDLSRELEESLILCNTNLSHNSGKIHDEQKRTYEEEGKVASLQGVVDNCKKMHKFLVARDLLSFARCISDSWEIKRRLSPSISNEKLDHIYSSAIKAGALSGKLLGAGAGGFFLFYVPSQCRKTVTDKLKSIGCTLEAVNFESEGVISWRAKMK